MRKKSLLTLVILIVASFSIVGIGATRRARAAPFHPINERAIIIGVGDGAIGVSGGDDDAYSVYRTLRVWGWDPANIMVLVSSGNPAYPFPCWGTAIPVGSGGDGTPCPTRANVLAGLGILAGLSGAGDKTFIYFAGHGNSVADGPENDEPGCPGQPPAPPGTPVCMTQSLVVWAGPGGGAAAFIDDDAFTMNIGGPANLISGQIDVVLDSCFGGGFAGSNAGGDPVQDISAAPPLPGVDPTLAGRTIVLAAAFANQCAADAPVGGLKPMAPGIGFKGGNNWRGRPVLAHGLFTDYLLEGLNRFVFPPFVQADVPLPTTPPCFLPGVGNGDGTVSTEEAFWYISGAVGAYVSLCIPGQNPEMWDGPNFPAGGSANDDILLTPYSDGTNLPGPPGTTSETQWVPSGPAIDTLRVQVYNDAGPENAALCFGPGPTPPACPQLDISDSPQDPTVIPGSLGNPAFYITPDGYAYLRNWSVGVVDQLGIGPPSFWSTLNAWSSSPPVGGPTMRWGAAGLSNPGFPATPAFDSLNIFSASSGPEFNLLNEIYEPLFRENPYSPTQLINWMGNFYRVETHATQPAECPAVYLAVAVGACLKMVLRGDISWHDIFNCAATDPVCLASHVVTANDVKFSFAAFSAATGSPIGSNTQNVIDVVYNPAVLPSAAYAASGGAQGSGIGETLFFYLHNNSPFALNDIAGIPIIPQHLWVTAAAPVQPNGVFVPCAALGAPSCTPDPVLMAGDPVVNKILVGSGPFVCASGALGAAGTVVGGGCTFNAIGAPIGQAIPAGGTAVLRRFGVGNNGLNLVFAYFRSNDKFNQFKWAAYSPATNSVGAQASIADIISAVNSCKAGGGLGGVLGYVACQHWNSPANLIDNYPAVGAANGVAGGGRNTLPGVIGPIVTQIQQWIGRGSWCFGAPSNLCSQLTDMQPIPQTLYDQGSSLGDFTVASSPPSVTTPSGVAAMTTITVTLSGLSDNFFGGVGAPYVPATATVASPGLATALTPLSNPLSPAAPTATATLTVTPPAPGTYTVIVNISIKIGAQPTVFRTVTVTVTGT